MADVYAGGLPAPPPRRPDSRPRPRAAARPMLRPLPRVLPRPACDLGAWPPALPSQQPISLSNRHGTCVLSHQVLALNLPCLILKTFVKETSLCAIGVYLIMCSWRLKALLNPTASSLHHSQFSNGPTCDTVRIPCCCCTAARCLPAAAVLAASSAP